HWMTDRGLAAATVNRNLASVFAVWRFAAKRRWLSEFPTVEVLREPRRCPDAWSERQIRALYTEARNTPGMVGQFKAGIWWSGMLTTIWWTAERISAVMQLRWSDFDLEERFVVIRAEVRKGGYADQKVPLTADTCELLTKLKREPDDLSF